MSGNQNVYPVPFIYGHDCGWVYAYAFVYLVFAYILRRVEDPILHLEDLEGKKSFLQGNAFAASEFSLD